MSVRFNFAIHRCADDSDFLQPWKVLIHIRSIEETLTQFELDHQFPPEKSAKLMVPRLLTEQIFAETGLTEFKVQKYLQDDTSYMVRMFDPESYLMFKLHYYGTSV